MQDQDAEHAPAANLVPARPAPRRKRGPQTAAGKRRVRFNALRHGLTARSLVLPGLERTHEWESHYAALRQVWLPTDAMEETYVRRMAESAWRQRRVIRFETAVFDVDGPGNRPGDSAAKRWFSSGYGIELLIRLDTHLLRQFDRAVRELLEYRERARDKTAVVLDVHPVADVDSRSPA